MRRLDGVLEVRTDGQARLHHKHDRTYVQVRAEDRLEASAPEAPDSDGQHPWVVTVADDAELTTGQLTTDEWKELFVTDQPRSFREPPSVHNSWCPQCTSVGVSHGVCCP